MKIKHLNFKMATDDIDNASKSIEENDYQQNLQFINSSVSFSEHFPSAHNEARYISLSFNGNVAVFKLVSLVFTPKTELWTKLALLH